MRTDKIEMGNRQNLEFSSDIHLSYLSSQVRKITCNMIDCMSDMH